jgi:cytochrome P450
VLADLRSEDPVHRGQHAVWIVTRYRDVDALNSDARLGRDLRAWRNYRLLRPYVAGSTLERYVEHWLLNLDPPDHTRLRRLASEAFTLRRVNAMRHTIGAMVDDLLDSIGSEEEFDFLERFAQVLPLRVIAGILSLPEADEDRLREWSDAIAHVVEPPLPKDVGLRADRAIREEADYLRERIAERRRSLGDDLLSHLIRAEAAGDRMSEDELVAMVALLFLAGHETTTNLLGNGLLTLARNPDAADRVRADRALIRTMVEEILRYEPSTLLNVRVTKQPIEVQGTEIPAAQLLYLVLGAANRDPDAFPDPDMFDVTRNPNPHLSFGGGAHYCIGAPLARLQGQVAFDRILQRWPSIRLAATEVRWRPMANIRGLESLPISTAR